MPIAKIYYYHFVQKEEIVKVGETYDEFLKVCLFILLR